MSLPTPNLDDLRFQADLVDEARKRIVQYCPEWTEYNLSDPGITLIEMFAWMTEMMVYRLNRVPEKNHIKFLELLGLKRKPASSARTELTFWLSVPLPISPDNLQDVVIPQGLEVRSSGEGSEEVVFSTDRILRVTPPLLSQIVKEKEIQKNYLPRLGIETFYPFDPSRPRQGDTFYLGFNPEKALSGHILKLNFTCEPTEAVGIRREDPPWVWECSLGNGIWQEVPLSTFRGEKDSTGGLNNPSGSLVLYLPLAFKPDVLNGREAYWVRCRLEQRHPSQGMYTESPRVLAISAGTLGATVPASHAQVVKQEFLGKSSGEPGQEFSLEHAPTLDLQEGETLLVEELRSGEYVLVPWEYVNDFAFSEPYDRHFSLDGATGKVLLGPSVRQSDGSVRQYGRIPDYGRKIFFSQYRYGGGSIGNLPENTVKLMTSSIAYVARVSNLVRASGGQDQETLGEVKLRAQRELYAQKRAVTAQDFEQLALNFSRTVARVKCITPRLETREPGVAQLLVVPSVQDSLQVGDLSRLHLDEAFVQSLTKHLDKFRLLTAHVRVCEPQYIGVKALVKIVTDDYSIPEVVQTRVEHHLRNLLNPLVPYPEAEQKDQLLDKSWIGWPLGKTLFLAEIYALVQRVPGVKYVLDVELCSRPVEPRLEGISQNLERLLAPVEEKSLRVPSDSLLCSLDHQVICTDMNELVEEIR